MEIAHWCSHWDWIKYLQAGVGVEHLLDIQGKTSQECKTALTSQY